MTDYETAKRNETWGETTEFEAFVCAWLMFVTALSIGAAWVAAVFSC